LEGSKLIQELTEEIFDKIYCCLPAKITKIHDDKSVDAQPLFKLNGKNMPALVQIPLLFMGNNNSVINIESQVGDYVLLLVADYDIDNLAIDGKIKNVNTDNKHDINDCFALPFSFTPFNSSKSQSNKINVDASGNITIETNSNIYLGEGSTESVPLGDSLKTWLDGHTHGGGSGPDTESPNPSSKVKVIN